MDHRYVCFFTSLNQNMEKELYTVYLTPAEHPPTSVQSASFSHPQAPENYIAFVLLSPPLNPSPYFINHSLQSTHLHSILPHCFLLSPMAPLLLCAAFLLLFLNRFTPADARPRAFFVFGDSLVDSGNNNYLVTSARADSPPYGIDYPTRHATGRFSNGLNIPDLISEKLGAEAVLPYLSPELTGERLLTGANFASAGIGILNDTGIQFLNIIRIFKQLEYFEQYQRRLGRSIGEGQVRRLVGGALVLITLGGNDFVNNYYLVPYSARSRQFSLPDFVRYIISEYRKILTRLYELGARKVLVTGTGPMGCVPAELAARGSRSGECDAELQRASGLFNPQLFNLLNQLNDQLGSRVFTGADPLGMNMNIIQNPQAYGFVTSKIACCGQGPYNGLGLCTSLSNLCPRRDLYLFWDSFHPSERACRMIVDQIFNGPTEYMNPVNLTTFLASHTAQTADQN